MDAVLYERLGPGWIQECVIPTGGDTCGDQVVLRKQPDEFLFQLLCLFAERMTGDILS
jgi:hypothetical protein